MEGIFDKLKAENNNVELSNELKDKYLELIDVTKNDEGYYLDAFDTPISFNGIRQLKRPYTSLNLSKDQQTEIITCHKDYFYFRRNYCKILTKSGIGRPEPREYQERLEKELVKGEDVVAFFPRQSGKCTHKDTYVNINKGDIYLRISVESLHNIDKIEKNSNINNKPKEHLTIESLNLNLSLTTIQEQRILEVLEVVNKLGFNYKTEYIKEFVNQGLEDNYILRIIEKNETI